MRTLKIFVECVVALTMLFSCAANGQQYDYPAASGGGERKVVMSRSVPLSQGRDLVEAVVIAIENQSYFSNATLAALEQQGWQRENDNSNTKEIDLIARLVIYADGRILLDCDSVGRVAKTPTVKSPMTISNDPNAIVRELNAVIEKQIHDTVEIFSKGK